jgi:hypothetical protein
MWALDYSFERGAVVYVLLWVAAHDGRIIESFMKQQNSTKETSD